MSQQPHQQQYPGPAAPLPAVKAKKPRRWPWILAVLAAFGIGAAVGSSSGGSTPAPAAAGASTSAVATAPAHSTGAPVATGPAAPAGPKTEVGDGTFKVGEDVAVGTYKTSGPRAGSPLCYWARLKDDSGTNIIANNAGQGPARVTVKAGEYLQVTGCDFTKA